MPVATQPGDNQATTPSSRTVDVVKRTVNQDSRFTALNGTESVRVYQRGLLFDAADGGKFLLAAVLDDDEYFYVPTGNTIFLNGLDGKTSVSETFTLFNSLDDIVEFIEERHLTHSKFVSYKLRLDGDQLLIEKASYYE